MMEKAGLPKEKAFEPDEAAHQPILATKMPPDGQNQSKKLTFAKSVDLSEKTSSQRSSSYKEVLSQPPTELSHVQKLAWLQNRRTAGLWAQCDDCNQWRLLPEVLDRHELPQRWYCWMNPDKEYASCSVPEAPLRIRDEEDLIHSEYSAGSLVWAHLAGWPWWPAMVDDCPDTEQFYWLDGFSDIPTHYNVVFFDTMEATRAWIAPDQLKPYTFNKHLVKSSIKNKKYYNRLIVAMSQADEAEKMTLERRLSEYSFIARHKGKINSPKKMKKGDLNKYQRQFKKKFNIDFPIESSGSDDDGNINTENKRKKTNNVIILGTPKRNKKAESIVSKAADQKQDKKSVEIETPPTSTELSPYTSVQPHSKHDGSAPASNVIMPTNSMMVQVGSTEADTTVNDTSTTYLPENSTLPLEFSIRIGTPNSDDFDF